MRRVASPDRFRYAWSSSKWLMPPRTECGSVTSGDGDWVSALKCEPSLLVNTRSVAAAIGLVSGNANAAGPRSAR